MNMREVIGDYETFFDDLYLRLRSVGIHIDGRELSHLGIKFASFEEYERMRDVLKLQCKSYAEHEHNGRPVALMWLRQPLALPRGFTCDLLELMPPKPNNHYPTGLEHVGVVIGDGLEAFGVQHAAVLSGRQDQGPINKPFYVSFDNGTRVKFYNLSMKDVIAQEGKAFAEL